MFVTVSVVPAMIVPPAAAEPGEDWPEWTPQQVREYQRLLAEEAAGERDALRDRIAGQVEETAS